MRAYINVCQDFEVSEEALTVSLSVQATSHNIWEVVFMSNLVMGSMFMPSPVCEDQEDIPNRVPQDKKSSWSVCGDTVQLFKLQVIFFFQTQLSLS